jgi:DNA-binding CsgD family transcriptional regulator
MKELTRRDLINVLKFVRGLYACHDEEGLASYILSELPNVIDTEVPVHSQTNFLKGQVSGLPCPPIDQEVAAQVVGQHFYEHPLVAHYLSTHDGRAYKISDFMEAKQLYRLEGLYEQFLRPIGMEDQMIIHVSTSGSMDSLQNQESLVTVGVHRSDRSFDESDRLLLNLLRPHVFQAFQNAQRVMQLERDRTYLHGTLETLGIIVLNADRQIRFISSRSEQWLEKYFSPFKSSTEALPDPLQRWLKYQISLVVQSSEIPKSCIPLKVECDRHQLIIRFVVDRPNDQFLLLLEEQQQPEISVEVLELLGLTRREAEVLFWMAQGKTNAEIAVLLTIRAGTVRKHVEHIYEKLEVQSRTAAVAVALKM